MNDKTVLFYVMIGLLLCGILVGVGYQVRQEIYRTNFIDQNYAELVQLAEKSASYTSVSSPANTQTTKLEQTDAATKQNELLKQQEQLYLDFTQIINALSEGQQPDPQQVSLLITQQQKLVEAQLVSRDEAKAQIEFLIKVLPEMDHELHRALRVLEQTRI
jgi:Na+-transporting NADH:ubiquinone oxidoreductase subunit NqrC